MLEPWMLDPLRWGTVGELARLLARPRSTIYRWLYTDTLKDFGIATYRDSHGRWWLHIPDDLRATQTSNITANT